MNCFASMVFLLLTFFCVPCAGYSALQDNVSEVPFTLENGHLIVQAKIQGNKSVELVLSTGSEYSLVNASLLDKYKLQAGYTGEGIITGSDLDRVVYFVPVADIQIGDVKATSINMRFGSQALIAISQRVGREIFAILGADFFKGRVVQFDFGKKVVRFLRQTPTDLLKNDKKSASTDRVVLQIRATTERIIRPVVENVTFDGKKIKTLLDTGALTAVSLTTSAAKQIGLSAPPEKGEPREDKVNSLRFEEMEITGGLPAMIYAKGSAFDHNSSGYGAVIGIGLLQNFVITFDFRKEVIILERLK
ncbi:MAG TPA: aspartyl protease family protein [Pyrinomonadaceae bacterium]|nr:aspartyl protease family protein [Pyrinomonadaceae bacterium]